MFFFSVVVSQFINYSLVTLFSLHCAPVIYNKAVSSRHLINKGVRQQERPGVGSREEGEKIYMIDSFRCLIMNKTLLIVYYYYILIDKIDNECVRVFFF